LLPPPPRSTPPSRCETTLAFRARQEPLFYSEPYDLRDERSIARAMSGAVWITDERNYRKGWVKISTDQWKKHWNVKCHTQGIALNRDHVVTSCMTTEGDSGERSGKACSASSPGHASEVFSFPS
jgi:hypothetical protein